MNKTLLILLILLIGQVSFSQVMPVAPKPKAMAPKPKAAQVKTKIIYVEKPAAKFYIVKWTSTVEKISDTQFNLVMEGKIDNGWRLYSQFTPDNGPLPAEFKFENAEGNYELVGKPKETPHKEQYNDVFEVDEYYFEKKVTFTQKIKVLNPKLTTIKAKIEFQVFKEICMNQENLFIFQLTKN